MVMTSLGWFTIVNAQAVPTVKNKICYCFLNIYFYDSDAFVGNVTAWILNFVVNRTREIG